MAQALQKNMSKNPQIDKFKNQTQFRFFSFVQAI